MNEVNDIGEKLKEARKEKGYTLDDLQQITKIQKRYLIAVEEGNLEVLPGNFYARAFIKQYADSVGLNGEELLEEHTDTLPQSNQPSVTKSVTNTQTRSRGKNSGFLGTLQDSLPTILIVLLVVAIVFAIYLAIAGVDRSGDDSNFIQENGMEGIVEVDDNEGALDSDENTEDSEDTDEDGEGAGEDTEEDAGEEEVDEPESQSVEETDSTTNSTTYTVTGEHPEEQTIVLSAEGGDTWVSVEVDGVMANQALLTNGESMTTEFDNTVGTINLVIGNAAATSISLNDETLPYGEAATEAVRQEMTVNFE